MSDERPIDPLREPAPEPREPAPARAYERAEPRPRRSARHAHARAARSARPERPARTDRPARVERPVRPARAAKAPRASRTAGGLPARGSAVRRRLVVAFTLLAIIVGVTAFGAWSTLYRASADVPAGRKVTITIPKGYSGEQVATMLAGAGIVANPTMFRVRVSILGAASKMKAGTYTLTTGSAYDHVIAVLSHGPEIEYVTFTIPEGWRIEQTAARIEEKLGIPASKFEKLVTTGAKQFEFAFLADNPTKSLEGYLFPKTYTVKKAATATEVVNVMLAQYGKETAVLDYSYAKSKGLDPHDVLTIASMIEREAVIAGERPKVAAVVYNRLRLRMLLQFCSTVQYVLGGKETLTDFDLKTPSPYNTYLHAGLPPGPICSPGLPSIKAALAPAKADYLYFVLTGKNGSQSFTSSYAEFLQLKEQAKRGLK